MKYTMTLDFLEESANQNDISFQQASMQMRSNRPLSPLAEDEQDMTFRPQKKNTYGQSGDPIKVEESEYTARSEQRSPFDSQRNWKNESILENKKESRISENNYKNR